MVGAHRVRPKCNISKLITDNWLLITDYWLLITDNW
jgi:hypothetical protein